MIEVTSEAAQQIKSLLSDDGKAETHGLRMKVIGGGCSGLQYQLSFDDVVRDIDTEIEVEGVRVIVDEKSALYLVGTRLDFVDTLQESGQLDNHAVDSDIRIGDWNHRLWCETTRVPSACQEQTWKGSP